MTFKDQVKADLDSIYSEFAEAITYNGLSVLGFPEYLGEAEEVPGGEAAEATIRIRISEVSQWSHRDTVVIGSETWRVQRKGTKRSDDQLEWILMLRRDQRPAMRK